jgi:hypothetical protein
MTEFASIDKLQFSFQASGDDLKLTKESAFLLDIVSKQQFGGYALNDKKEITTQITDYATIETTFLSTTFNSSPTSPKLQAEQTLQLHTDRPIYKHTNDKHYVVFEGKNEAASETGTKGQFILIDCTKEIAIAKYSGNEAARAISGGTRKRRARRKPSKTPKRYRRKKV